MKCNHIDKASTRLDLTSVRVRVTLCRIPACVFICPPCPLPTVVIQVSDCRLPQWSRMCLPLLRLLSLHPFSCHVCPCVRFVRLSLFAIPLFGQAISSRADCVGLSHLFGQCQCQVYHSTQQRRRLHSSLTSLTMKATTIVQEAVVALMQCRFPCKQILQPTTVKCR